MRLIDADKLKQNVLDWEDCYNGFSDTYDKARIIGEIEEQPTIDAEPIRHGKWIECESENGIHFHKCSVCKQRDMYQGSFAEWGARGFSFYFKRQYCPYCGARMDDDEISNIAKESADKISNALEKVRAKGMQKQNIKEDDKP